MLQLILTMAMLRPATAKPVAQVQTCVWPHVCAETVAQVQTCVWPHVCHQS